MCSMNFKKSKKHNLILFYILLAFSLGTYAQQAEVTVKGVVQDEGHLPLPGTTIIIKGSTKGATSDFDGFFSIKAAIGDVLQISFLGFKTKEIPVIREASNLIVILEGDAQGLDEIIIVGYGSVRKKDLTGSVSSLKLKDEAAMQATSVDHLMQGKIAGLSVLSGSEGPGSSNSITIRGASSLRGDNQPLFVIDNIPINSTAEVTANPFGNGGGDVQIAQNPLTSLNPQDIESIEVLKDASATAIYGSRGANGVIIITTKKGKAGKVKVTFNSNITITEATREHKMLGLLDYAKHQRSKFATDDEQKYFIQGNEVRGVFDGDGANYDPNNPNTYFVLQNQNWQDQIYRTGISKNYGLTISGGSEKTRYYLSAGYKGLEGLVKQTGLKQGNLRLNLNSKINDKLTTNIVLSASARSNDMMQGADLLKGTSSGSITRAAIDRAPHDNLPGEVDDFENRTTIFSWLNDYDDLTRVNNFSGSANIRYKISHVFTYSGRVGVNYMDLNRSRWFGLQLFKGANDNGSLGIVDLKRQNYSIENLINFNKKISKNFSFNGVIGSTYDDYNTTNKLYSGVDFDIHDLRTKGLHLANNATISTPVQNDNQILSYLGRINLNLFKGKYLTTFSYRADGSSKFTDKNKWGYFPSAALAWKLNEESFLMNVKQIDQIKLRFGWGKTGNQSISPYSTINDFALTSNTYADSEGNQSLAASLQRIANQDLVWETTEAINAGINFSLFGDRISGDIDVYRKTTKDLLINQKIPPSTGFGSIVVNQGSLENKGLEISLNAHVIDKKDFSFNVSGNIAFNRGEVLDIGIPESEWGIHTLKAFTGDNLGQSYFVDPANIYAVGYAPALFWGYESDGIIKDPSDLEYIDENGDTQQTTSTISSTEVGNYKFVDQNGDGVVNPEDLTFLGDPNPDFTYGFQLDFSYKQWSLSTSFNGVQGIDKLNANRYSEFHTGVGGQNIRQEAFDNIWSPTNPSGIYPAATSQRVQKITDILIEDASFLRLSDITWSYQLPTSITKKLGIEKLNLFVTGKNLFVITNYSGYDPEVSSLRTRGLRQGVDWSGFPRAKAYTFGFNVNF